MLSAAYFVNELFIPNVTGTTVLELANLKNLQIAMNKYEIQYLKRLMGDDLYTLYAAGVTAGTAKYTALRDLIFVTYSSPSYAESPAANYVYFFFMRNASSLTLSNSEVQSLTENFSQYSPAQKMINAWNDMVRKSEEIQTYITDHLTDYPEYNPEYFETLNSFGF